MGDSDSIVILALIGVVFYLQQTNQLDKVIKQIQGMFQSKPASCPEGTVARKNKDNQTECVKTIVDGNGGDDEEDDEEGDEDKDTDKETGEADKAVDTSISNPDNEKKPNSDSGEDDDDKKVTPGNEDDDNKRDEKTSSTIWDCNVENKEPIFWEKSSNYYKRCKNGSSGYTARRCAGDDSSIVMHNSSGKTCGRYLSKCRLE